MRKSLAILAAVLFAVLSLSANPINAQSKFANFSMTFFPVADTDIGTNFNPSFSTAHTVADCLDCSTSSYITAETSVGDWQGVNLFSVIRGALNFDTSAIGSNATITSAVLSVKSSNIHFDYTGTDYIRLVRNNSSTLTLLDFNAFGTAAQANDAFVSAIWTNQFVSFTLNSSGKSHINKSGISRFGLRTGHDVNFTQPVPGTDPNFPDKGGTLVFFYSSETPGTASDPRLTVNFTR